MDSSEDEFDYMSDKFIIESTKEDIRPGLLKSRSQKRHHEMCKKKLKTDERNKHSNRPTKVIEAMKREEGLNRPLSNDNIGFKMMQKLGFQPGKSLGKIGTGITEPISIELKTDRQGLGRQSVLKEIEKMKEKYKREALTKHTNVSDYRARLTEQAVQRRDMIDLKRSQRVCRELDTKDNLVAEEPWFWPEDDVSKDADCSELKKEDSNLHEEETEDESDICQQDLTVQEKLAMLTLYLRNTYFYCLWCGTTFEGYTDLSAECPGPTRDDH